MKRKYYSRQLIVQILLSVFLVSGAVSLVKAQSQTNDWLGKYEFFDSERGSRPNQPSSFITYTLTVISNGSELKGRFQADGTQTNDEFECSIETTGSQIKVYFQKDLNGNNAEMFKPLKKGQLLFTLTKIRSGSKTTYHFKKAEYEILPLSPIKTTKIFFTKKKIKWKTKK